MQIHFCRRVDGDIVSLLFDDVSPDDSAGDGCAAAAAIEVNAGWAGSRCVADIGAVARDVVGGDDVVVEVVGRQAELRTNVAVKGYSRNAIVLEVIVGDDVAGNRPIPLPSEKMPTPAPAPGTRYPLWMDWLPTIVL